MPGHVGWFSMNFLNDADMIVLFCIGIAEVTVAAKIRITPGEVDLAVLC